MKWTEAQQLAIDAPKPGELKAQTLLVAAAAGSGKTAVLVERIISRLRRKELSVRELMVVTFTKAAAAEMSARIGAKLSEEYNATGDPYLEEQLNLLPSAHISTLHSFCQWVIRSYFYELDMDPHFRIGNEGELTLLKEEVMAEVFEKAYEEGLYHIFHLGEMFNDNRSDRALMDQVYNLYYFAIAQSDPRGWLEEIRRTYAEPALSLQNSLWGSAFWRAQEKNVRQVARIYGKIMKLLELSPKEFEKWIEQVGAIQQFITAMERAETWNSMHAAVRQLDNIKYPVKKRSNVVAASDYADEIEEIHHLFDEGKELLKSMLMSSFTITEEDWQEQWAYMQPVGEGLIDLTLAFYDAYAERKKLDGCMDFSDLEHMCLRLLCKDGDVQRLEPSTVALELQQQFKEVMVDEYQDTNGVQEAICNLVSRIDNRFYVGDVKQSIYKFRMADPSLFMEKYRDFGRDLNDVQRRIDLSQNFRSHENILKVTNFIFRQIMTEEGSELAYGDEEALYAGRKVEDPPENWVGGDVELHLIHDDGSGPSDDPEKEDFWDGLGEDEEELENQDREVAFIIEEMKRLKEEGKLVQDKDGTFRPIAWRDMVVLMRSTSSRSNRLIEMFRAAGIPAYAEEKSGYFSSIEVQLLLSLLQIIDNPEQDLPMSIVLRSPLVGMDDATLGALRVASPTTLWEGFPCFVAQEEHSRWVEFVNQLEEWRTMCRRETVSDLLWHIFETTHFVDYVSGMPNGVIRRANVLALYERAKQFESGNFRGLFRFLRFLESLKDSGQDLSVASTVTEGDDVVRIMTIHKSKGLEFPVVFLASAQKKFNMMDLAEPVLLHKDYGMALKGYFPDLRVMYPSIPWMYMREELRQALLAEEERVLYVALTRAKDKLYVTGFVKGDMAKQVDKFKSVLQQEHIQLPKDIILKAKCYLDWFLMTIMRHLDGGNALRVMTDVERVELPKVPDRDCAISLHLHQAKDYAYMKNDAEPDYTLINQVRRGELVEADPLPEEIVQRFDFNYEYQGAVRRAAKISVSEIKRRMQALDEEAMSLLEELKRSSCTEDAILDTATMWLESMAQEEPSMMTNLVSEAIVVANGDHEEYLEEELGAFAMPLYEEEDGIGQSGTRFGTLTHEALQWLPLKTYTKKELQEELDQLVLQGYFSSEERNSVHIQPLYNFYKSDLAKRMRKSKRVEREFPFSLLFPAHRVYADVEEGETLFLQGIIDVAFLEEGQWVLVDYKTDYVHTPEELVQRYQVQLMLYKEALERLTEYPVKEVLIYSTRLHNTVRVDG